MAGELLVNLEHAVALARVALTFGQVERATRHPDGSPETDSTHTVMLAMIVAELAEEEGIDAGLAVQFAFVHDLPETYAGDTCTVRGLSESQELEKERREANSLERLEEELGDASWTTRMVRRYERQQEPEARLVRYADKVVPKLTHLLNRGLALEELEMTAQEWRASRDRQRRELEEEYPEFKSVKRLLDEACSAAEGVLRG